MTRTWKPENQLGIMVTEDRTQNECQWRPVCAGPEFAPTFKWLKESIKRGARTTSIDVMDYMISHGVKPSQIILEPERASDDLWKK